MTTLSILSPVTISTEANNIGNHSFSGKSITLLAFNDLLTFFRTGTKGHDPSPEMLEGLYNLQDTLSGMLTGELVSKVFVSSLDPGVGKTSAIKSWLKMYLPRRKMYGDKGVILCFDRLEEIQRFLEDNSLSTSDYGVYCAIHFNWTANPVLTGH